jgi:hypothetical protein
MKRLLWLMSLSVLLVMPATELSARGKRVVLERDAHSQSSLDVAKNRWEFATLHKEWKRAAEKVRSVVATCARTVITVAKALTNAAKTVLISVGKLAFRIAISLLLVLGHWLFGVLV